MFGSVTSASRRTLLISFLAAGSIAFSCPAAVGQTDPLPSWNDGVAKKSITGFVARVTTQGGPDFVEPAERIATFDNDGTLWTEQPVDAQLKLSKTRLAQMTQLYERDAGRGFDVEQKGMGKFEIPNWDQVSQKKVRDALLVLAATTAGFRNAFGTKDQVDPIRHLIGTAAGWGGNPDKDAIYLGVTPPNNDGTVIYKLNAKDVPVNGFWSVSVYNAEGYFEKNPQNAYSVNNVTAQKAAGGPVAIQFGGCDGKIPNCIPIMKGWNYTVRLYRARAEILSGKWKFPELQPAS